jgi:pimeloyl-ACP methyl ester carboxylesterase
MATIILVAGAMLTGAVWQQVIPLLEQSGHRPIAVDLPGMGDASDMPAAQVSLSAWRAHVAELARSAVPPVILIGQSRGGLVIGEAAEVAPEAIAGLIYITALIVPPGHTAADVLGLNPATPMPGLSADGAAFRLPADISAAMFFNRCSPTDAARAVAQMCFEPIAPIVTRASVTWDRWGRVPRAYIECTEDASLTLQRQREIQAAAPCNPVLAIDADHSPFLSAPQALAAAIVSIIAEFAIEPANPRDGLAGRLQDGSPPR